MASDFAPTFLSPVGHGIVELHRLLIDFQVQAFTLSQCSGQLIPDSILSFSSAITGGRPSLNV